MNDATDLSLEDLQQELDGLEEQETKVQQRIQELKDEHAVREKEKEKRRLRLLPFRHPDDTRELDHCVSCGRLLREWIIEYDHQEGRNWRHGVKETHEGAFEAFDGLRCSGCHETLMARVLDMLDGSGPVVSKTETTAPG